MKPSQTTYTYIELSSQQSVRDYSHHVKAHVGFSDENWQAANECIANAHQIQDKQKYVTILMDEMRIHDDLVEETARFVTRWHILRVKSALGMLSRHHASLETISD